MTSRISHGRRKGEIKTSPPFDIIPAVDENGVMSKTDLRDVTILSKDDWERINLQLHQQDLEKHRIEKLKADKEQMKEKSRNLVQYWTNTIAGQRQLKLEARKLREQKEEEDRKAIDIEEAKYQAEKRHAAIEKAKTQMYYETDRVKNFHTALKLTEALKERDNQTELKRLKMEAMKKLDVEWYENDRKQYDEWLGNEQNLAANMRLKNVKNKEFVDAQRKALEKIKDQERLNDIEEGHELRRLGEAHKREQLELDEIKQAEVTQLRNDNVKYLQDKKTLDEMKEKQREEEEEECRIFAAAKRKMIRLRNQKEQQIHDDKLQRLNNISVKLASQMKAKKDDEEERIKRAEEEKDELRRIEDEIKAKHMKQAIDAISAHRKLQFGEHEDAARKEIQDGLEERQRLKELNDILDRKDAEKEANRIDNDKNVANFRLDQSKHRKDQANADKDLQLALDLKNFGQYEEEERQFQEYAAKVIGHAKKGGRNVVPLVKAAREGAGGGHGPVFPEKGNVRPRYIVSDQSLQELPTYQRSETENVKKLVDGGTDSKNKMGFVW